MDNSNLNWLPLPSCYNESMQTAMPIVANSPEVFIIPECIPACKELWEKNIYTFMVSDHLNTEGIWIEFLKSSLSQRNLEVYQSLHGNDVLKFSYHFGTLNFGVKQVGIEGQRRLLELAKLFQYQDVPAELAYLPEEQFLVNYCHCFQEVQNPNYYEMVDIIKAFEEGIVDAEYREKYGRWERSDDSKPFLKVYDPEKKERSTKEYADELDMFYVPEEGRVYLGKYHYDKHLAYIVHRNTLLN